MFFGSGFGSVFGSSGFSGEAGLLGPNNDPNKPAPPKPLKSNKNNKMMMMITSHFIILVSLEIKDVFFVFSIKFNRNR
jgi:hypothetical protein